LGNRIQHALRAFTPRDTKAVKAAADTFRPNPEFSAFETITQLGVGEALVSTLEDKGVPSIVQRTLIRPPSSRIGTISEEERRQVIAASPIGTIYDKAVDRESAFEVLSMRVESKTETVEGSTGQPRDAEGGTSISDMIGELLGTNRPRGKRLTATQRVARSVTRTLTTRVIGGAAADIGKRLGGSVGGSVGRAIVRGVLGGILRS
jgi:DNA double-strand break repair helicase HerA and related ATPase